MFDGQNLDDGLGTRPEEVVVDENNCNKVNGKDSGGNPHRVGQA
jgi:hypothetical protein